MTREELIIAMEALRKTRDDAIAELKELNHELNMILETERAQAELASISPERRAAIIQVLGSA